MEDHLTDIAMTATDRIQSETFLWDSVTDGDIQAKRMDEIISIHGPSRSLKKKKKKEKAGTGEGTIALYEKPAVKSQAGALSFQAFPHFLWINNSLAGRKRIHLR